MSAKGPRRIGVLGAGPAGLYFALLAKKSGILAIDCMRTGSSKLPTPR